MADKSSSPLDPLREAYVPDFSLKGEISCARGTHAAFFVRTVPKFVTMGTEELDLVRSMACQALRIPRRRGAYVRYEPRLLAESPPPEDYEINLFFEWGPATVPSSPNDPVFHGVHRPGGRAFFGRWWPDEPIAPETVVGEAFLRLVYHVREVLECYKVAKTNKGSVGAKPTLITCDLYAYDTFGHLAFRADHLSASGPICVIVCVVHKVPRCLGGWMKVPDGDLFQALMEAHIGDQLFRRVDPARLARASDPALLRLALARGHQFSAGEFRAARQALQGAADATLLADIRRTMSAADLAEVEGDGREPVRPAPAAPPTARSLTFAESAALAQESRARRRAAVEAHRAQRERVKGEVAAAPVVAAAAPPNQARPNPAPTAAPARPSHGGTDPSPMPAPAPPAPGPRGPEVDERVGGEPVRRAPEAPSPAGPSRRRAARKRLGSRPLSLAELPAVLEALERSRV